MAVGEGIGGGKLAWEWFIVFACCLSLEVLVTERGWP